MHPINALAVVRTAVGLAGGARGMTSFVVGSDDIPLDSPWWYIYAGISCFLVLFAGLMSGLTLGLMSLGLVDLEILQQGGTPAEKKQPLYFLSCKSNINFWSLCFSAMQHPWRHFLFFLINYFIHF